MFCQDTNKYFFLQRNKFLLIRFSFLFCSYLFLGSQSRQEIKQTYKILFIPLQSSEPTKETNLCRTSPPSNAQTGDGRQDIPDDQDGRPSQRNGNTSRTSPTATGRHDVRLFAYHQDDHPVNGQAIRTDGRRTNTPRPHERTTYNGRVFAIIRTPNRRQAVI